METYGRVPGTSIRIEPDPFELPLTIVVAIVSAGLWLLLAISLIGIFYALILGLVFFVAHVVFVTHIRGNGVKLSPNQMPDLYQRVLELSERMGFEKIPEAYLIQEGGLLNALATKFFRSNLIVLYSDLIEACGDNHAARDMIVAHELGHLKQGHLKWHWFLLPGLLMPFLGTSLSRAREYTCDRYGLAGAGEMEGALRGLAILAAGAERGPKVNLQEMARQVEGLNTGWMTIGQWLSTHPTLAKRMIALNQALKPAPEYTLRGILRALGLVGAVYVLPSILLAVGLIGWGAWLSQQKGSGGFFGQTGSTFATEKPLDALEQATMNDLKRMESFVHELWAKEKKIPDDAAEFFRRWEENQPGKNSRKDPFGRDYLYQSFVDTFVIYSVGHNGVTDDDEKTGDDLVIFSELRPVTQTPK